MLVNLPRKSLLFRILVRGFILLSLLLGLTFFPIQSASATIRQHPEAPGKILYQSRHRLTDTAHRSWQLILFKQIEQEQIKQISLRIVGFPGEVKLNHPEPLTIITDRGKVLQASDEFVEYSPAANVGQYDFKNILEKLSMSSSISLELNLNSQPKIQLNIPSEVLLEWQIIAS